MKGLEYGTVGGSDEVGVPAVREQRLRKLKDEIFRQDSFWN